MKFLITILLLLPLISFSQTAKWNADYYDSSTVFLVERTLDSTKTFDSVQTIIGIDSCPITTPNYYYRVRVGNVVSNSVLLPETLPVTITNAGTIASKSFIQVYWTSQNENNLKNYEIDQSFDGVSFTPVNTTTPKGNSNYSVVINRPVVTSQSCSFKIFGICLSYKTITTIDSRKEIFQIISVDLDGTRTILKTVAE